jgi:hypothetical protein
VSDSLCLLIRRSKNGPTAVLVDDYESAVIHAKKFVGDHNPVDSCSSVRDESTRRTPRGVEFSCSRSTSFGLRSASVLRIGYDFETRIS